MSSRQTRRRRSASPSYTVVRTHAELVGSRRTDDLVVDRADGCLGLGFHGREGVDDRHVRAVAVVQGVARIGRGVVIEGSTLMSVLARSPIVEPPPRACPVPPSTASLAPRWRKSAFDLARARHTKRLRPWRWLTEPVSTFRVWLATGRLSLAKRARWNRRAEAAAAADPLLSALDPHQRRAAACFEDRAMVTAGAGSGKTRAMVARAGYAARRLGTPPEGSPSSPSRTKATEEIRQRTRERLPGLQVGTIHQIARRVLKLVDGRTVQLSPMAGGRRPAAAAGRRLDPRGDRPQPGARRRPSLRRNARSAAVKDGELVERHRIPPDGREVKSRGGGRCPAGRPEGLSARLLSAGRPGGACDGERRRLARALRARPERPGAGGVRRLRGGARLEAASAR